MNKEEVKKSLKKFWYFLWKDDSLAGWAFSLIFIFVFIRFIFFPLLIIITGTPLPLAIVESCSMYHNDGFLSDLDSWWEDNKFKYFIFEINKTDFENFQIKNGFNKGDILFITGKDPEKLELGDIIIFNANQRNPVIHRIVNIEESNGERIFSTMGDNNPGQLSFEENINEDQIIGKATQVRIPYLGWIKLIFFEWQKPIDARGFCS